MSHKKTVLLMSRGMRTHYLFREMAADLTKDYRVVVLAAPEEVHSFSSIKGVEAHCYETHDILSAKINTPTMSLKELQAAARRIEQEIGVPVYKAASNFLLYGRIVKSYAGRWNYLDKEKDILRAYVGAYAQLSTLFERNNPSVVFYETIDLLASYIAFVLAYRRGIFALDFRLSPLSNGKVSVGFGLHRKNLVLEYLYTHRESLLASSYAVTDDILTRPREYLYATSYATANQKMLPDNSPLNPKKFISLFENRQRFTHGIKNIAWHYRAARNRAWLGRNLTNQLPTEPYIVFFLQHLPEASTCSQAPRWVYPDMIIEQLAINAPSHLKVVVKEHPRSYGRKGRDFFKPLQDLPNVLVCHPAIDNFDLVSHADAVIAITGTVGLEGIVLGKRVGVLGRPYYSIYNGVRVLDYPEDIYEALQDQSWRPEDMVDERRHFLAAYIQSLYEFGHGEGTKLYPASGGGKWAQALRETTHFIETYNLKPSAFDTGLKTE